MVANLGYWAPGSSDFWLDHIGNEAAAEDLHGHMVWVSKTSEGSNKCREAMEVGLIGRCDCGSVCT